MSDCGKTFEHDPHSFRDDEGMVRACDGSVTKENIRER